jgi:hypothetical protein
VREPSFPPSLVSATLRRATLLSSAGVNQVTKVCSMSRRPGRSPWALQHGHAHGRKRCASRLLSGAGRGRRASGWDAGYVAHVLEEGATKPLTLFAAYLQASPATTVEGDLPLVRTPSLGIRCCLSWEWLWRCVRGHRSLGGGCRVPRMVRHRHELVLLSDHFERSATDGPPSSTAARRW